MEKIKIFSDISRLKENKKDFEILDTNNSEIKILIINRFKNPIILRAIENNKINESKYEKYFFKDEFSKLIELNWKKFQVISILSNQWYTDWKYYTDEHIAMETLDEYKWKWIINEIFKVKNIVDETLNKSSSRFASVISVLIKNWYKVIWKLDEKSWKIINFTGQEFIEKIVKLKTQKWYFSDRLSATYVFQKQS